VKLCIFTYYYFLRKLHTDKEKENALVALRNSLGVIKDACSISGIPRRTFYYWIEVDPDFKKQVDEIKEESVDFVESKMFERIKGYEHEAVKIFPPKKSGEKPIQVTYTEHYPPSESLIQFYLKTKGKDRGYVEKQQIEHSGFISTKDLSDEDLERIATENN
jgi:hypothetical protein